jgi:hypothetical protein
MYEESERQRQRMDYYFHYLLQQTGVAHPPQWPSPGLPPPVAPSPALPASQSPPLFRPTAVLGGFTSPLPAIQTQFDTPGSSLLGPFGESAQHIRGPAPVTPDMTTVSKSLEASYSQITGSATPSLVPATAAEPPSDSVTVSTEQAAASETATSTELAAQTASPSQAAPSVTTEDPVTAALSEMTPSPEDPPASTPPAPTA